MRPGVGEPCSAIKAIIRFASVTDQPKGLSFGFRPKVSVSVGAEIFRQKSAFQPKDNFSRNTPFRPKLALFRPKLVSFSKKFSIYFSRKTSFRPKLPSFGRNSLFWFLPAFGRNCRFQNPLFRFRPKLFRLTTALSRLSRDSLSQSHTLSNRRTFYEFINPVPVPLDGCHGPRVTGPVGQMGGADGSPVREKCTADALLARRDPGGGGLGQRGVHRVVRAQEAIEVGSQLPVVGFWKTENERRNEIQ